MHTTICIGCHVYGAYLVQSVYLKQKFIHLNGFVLSVNMHKQVHKHIKSVQRCIHKPYLQKVLDIICSSELLIALFSSDCDEG